MKKRYALISSIFILACGQSSSTTSNETDVPDISYSIINARNDNGGQVYDIYLKDTAQIKTLNSYLKEKYNQGKRDWIQINYFNDSEVAKSYFDNQYSTTISDKEKDKLFRFFIANYKYNPATKYDSL